MSRLQPLSVSDLPEGRRWNWPCTYVVHFERPISTGHTTQHYCGAAWSLTRRMQEHAAGRGARLMAVALERSNEPIIAAVYRTKAVERRIKRSHNIKRFCPVCRLGWKGVRLAYFLGSAAPGGEPADVGRKG